LPSTGGGADDQDDRLCVALVPKLQGGTRLDDGDRAARQLDPLGRVAEEECRGALEDDEQLLLNALAMAGAACAGRQTPDVGAHLVQGLGERRATPSPVASQRRLKRALLGPEDRVPHGGKLADRPRKRKPPRAGQCRGPARRQVDRQPFAGRSETLVVVVSAVHAWFIVRAT